MLKWTILQQMVFFNQNRMLQQTWRNTIGRHSIRVHITCRAFPLWLEHQSSSLLLFVRFSNIFSSVICLFAPLAVLNKLILYSFCTYIFDFILYFSCLTFNLLNAELNPSCKSQLAEFSEWAFKFCACLSKNVNISRTKWHKFTK